MYGICDNEGNKLRVLRKTFMKKLDEYSKMYKYKFGSNLFVH